MTAEEAIAEMQRHPLVLAVEVWQHPSGGFLACPVGSNVAYHQFNTWEPTPTIAEAVMQSLAQYTQFLDDYGVNELEERGPDTRRKGRGKK